MKLLKNKKGIADDFGSLLVAGFIMVVMAIIVLVYSGLQAETYKSKHEVVANLEDVSYSTRIILQWEFPTGMKVHESLTKHNKENTLDEFYEDMYSLLESQGLTKDKTWMILIKSSNMNEPIIKDTHREEFFEEVKGNKYELKRNSYLALPRIKISDDETGIIEIVIKQVTKQDIEYYKKQDELKSLGDLPT